MAEKPLQTPEKKYKDSPVEVLVTNPDEVAIATEDGGLIIDFDDGAELGTPNFDDNIAEFIPALNDLVKSGTRVSWWNDFTETGPFHIDGTVYEAINITPEKNMYFSNTTYYLPKKQF